MKGEENNTFVQNMLDQEDFGIQRWVGHVDSKTEKELKEFLSDEKDTIQKVLNGLGFHEKYAVDTNISHFVDFLSEAVEKTIEGDTKVFCYCIEMLGQFMGELDMLNYEWKGRGIIKEKQAEDIRKLVRNFHNETLDCIDRFADQ